MTVEDAKARLFWEIGRWSVDVVRTGDLAPSQDLLDRVEDLIRAAQAPATCPCVPETAP